jgi:hypothetical protein
VGWWPFSRREVRYGDAVTGLPTGPLPLPGAPVETPVPTVPHQRTPEPSPAALPVPEPEPTPQDEPTHEPLPEPEPLPAQPALEPAPLPDPPPAPFLPVAQLGFRDGTTADLDPELATRLDVLARVLLSGP